MTRVLVTSAVRHAGQTQHSGYLRTLDLETGEVVHLEAVVESDWRDVDPNPRGGTRGARGVSASHDRLAIANANALFVFTASWELERRLEHPLAGAIHDVRAEEDGVWLACANADLLLKLGWEGDLLDSWCWRDDPGLVRALGFRSVPRLDPTLDYRDPRAIQSGVHNTIHLNAMARVPEGMLLSFGRVLSPRDVRRRQLVARAGRLAARFGITRVPARRPLSTPASVFPGSSYAVVLLRHDRSAKLLLRVDGTAVPNHNLLWDDGLVYLDSNHGRVVWCDIEPYRERASLSIPGSPSFARGLAQLEDGSLLVGSQRPLAVYRIDPAQRSVRAAYPLGGEEEESVYAVCPLPSTFGPQPVSVFGQAGRSPVAGGVT